MTRHLINAQRLWSLNSIIESISRSWRNHLVIVTEAKPSRNSDATSEVDQQEHQRHYAVANGAQQACAQVIHKHDHNAKVDHDDVVVGIFQNFCRGIQQLQQGMQAEKACRCNDQRGDQANDDRPHHRALEQVFVLRAVGARCNDGKAIADTNAKAD